MPRQKLIEARQSGEKTHLMIEKDAGNPILILMSNKNDWKRLKDVCNQVLNAK